MQTGTTASEATLATIRDRVPELLNKGLSVREVAAVLNVTTQAVYLHMKSLGIPPPSRRSESVQEPAA